MRILVSETTWAAMAIANDLANAGFLVTPAADGGEVFEYADLAQQNVILLDVDLPDMSGHHCLRQLRRTYPRAAIVMMAPPKDLAAKLRAFQCGADDVIEYKAEPREVAARLQAIARRRAGLSAPTIQVADLTLDCAQRRASIAGKPLHLTRLEYELVEMLALRAGKIVSKDEIMAQIYALGDAPDPKIIGVYICHIRAKISALGGDAGIVENVRGRGYALVNSAPLRIAA